MFDLPINTLQSFQPDSPVLEVAYELYLQAPQNHEPVINLKEVSDKTGVSLLKCRNIIVLANRVGHFPDCFISA